MTPDDPRDHDPGLPGPSAPLSPDELASALLDGALSPDQAAAARRDPVVVARAAEMDAARVALRAVPSPGAAARDRALNAALAAFDVAPGPLGEGPATAGTRTPGGHTRVADLEARRRRSARRTPRWLAAAAAAALVIAGVASLAILGSGSSDESSDMAAEVAGDEQTSASGGGAGDDAESAGEAAEAPSAPSADAGSATSRTAAAEVGDLGTFASADRLTDEVGSRLDVAHDDDGVRPDASQAVPRPDVTTPSAEALGALDVACPGGVPAPLDDPARTLRLHGRAVVGGQAVDVWVIGTAGGDRVLALDSACAVVVDQPLG
jgi:hypothetical protein